MNAVLSTEKKGASLFMQGLGDTHTMCKCSTMCKVRSSWSQDHQSIVRRNQENVVMVIVRLNVCSVILVDIYIHHNRMRTTATSTIGTVVPETNTVDLTGGAVERLRDLDIRFFTRVIESMLRRMGLCGGYICLRRTAASNIRYPTR